MSVNKHARGTQFSVTASGGASSVATQAAVAGVKYYITDIAGSTDKATGLLLVKQGVTTIWQIQLGTNTATSWSSFQQSFQQPLEGAVGALVSVTVDGTSISNANIAGFSLPTLG